VWQSSVTSSLEGENRNVIGDESSLLLVQVVIPSM
jgi:hypothetical protein